jgi:aspartyl-tRNA(Asn)/glutamyl-tRNA(Gln) amidotransferase subunit C
MKIDEAEVRRIVALARVELEEPQRFIEQFRAVLDFVAVLDEVGAEPAAVPAEGADRAAELRPDEPHACLDVELALGNAPESELGHFRVPKVIAE